MPRCTPAPLFGNLIALPLQGGPRRDGNSVFLADDFEPHRDQWAFLSSLRRQSAREVTAIADEATRRGRAIGLRLPVEDRDEEPWTAPPSRRLPLPEIAGAVPERIEAVLGDQLYIPRAGLPSGLVNRLIRLAAFQNPAFYSAQAMRRSTIGIPRIVACAELPSHHIALPRGCREAMESMLEELGTRVDVRDVRNPGNPVDTDFCGQLTPEQQAAADALLRHDNGVLAAATGFGKTVVAASVIASRGMSTLVLVHRLQLMDQWIAQLAAFLDLPAASIGQIGGGRRKPRGRRCRRDTEPGALRGGGRHRRRLRSSRGRREHARRLADRLADSARNVLVLRGGMGTRERRALMQRLEEIPEAEERVLVATGRYIGEGFDDARLDTLFLTMPFSWRGTLAQYVGRLHRLHPGMREVRVYDYVDEHVPMLRRMSEKRVSGYRSLGYGVEADGSGASWESSSELWLPLPRKG